MAVLNSVEFARDYRRGGESSARAPRGFAADHPLINEIKRKDFVAMSAFDESAACSAGLVALLIERLRGAAGLVDYLCAALDLDY